MRKAPFAAAVVAASVAFSLGVPTAAEARTVKDLKICWLSPNGTNFPLKVVIDGPMSRSANLASGTCQEWNVRGGDYGVFLTDLEGVEDIFYGPNGDYTNNNPDAVCGTPPPQKQWAFFEYRATVKRFKQTYQTRVVPDRAVETTVKNNHLTSVNFRFKCFAF